MHGFHSNAEAPNAALIGDKNLAVSVEHGHSGAVSFDIKGSRSNVEHGHAAAVAFEVFNPENRIELIHLRFLRNRRFRGRGRAWIFDRPLQLVPPVEPNAVQLRTTFSRNRRFRKRGRGWSIAPHMIDFARRQASGRGLYRIFNAAEYRFFRTDGSPPAEGDTPLESNATLPHTTAATWADGNWYVSVDFFNGNISSGFLVLGENGETWIRLPISGGASVGAPPRAPADVRIQNVGGGVVKVFALYTELGDDRADTWAIAFTTNGVDPPEDAPDVTVAMLGSGVEVLEYLLPAQANGTTVKVRVQTRRSGTAYSEGSQVLQVTADAVGPTAPVAGVSWPGSIQEG